MGTVKCMMMDAGEKGMIIVNPAEAARWRAATGRQVFLYELLLDAGWGRASVPHGVIHHNEARRLAYHPGLAAEDREELLWRLEVGGLPTTELPPEGTYTLADRLSDLRYTAIYCWPARLWAAGFVATAATVASVARRLGLRTVALRAVWYSYDVADHDPADSTWGTIMRLAPWAWTAEERFSPEAGY